MIGSFSKESKWRLILRRCSVCSAIRRRHIKVALRFCLTLGRPGGHHRENKGLLVGLPSPTPFAGNSTSCCAPGSAPQHPCLLFFVRLLSGAPPSNTSTPWGHAVGANSVPLGFSYRPSQAFPLHYLHSFLSPTYPRSTL